MDWVIRWTAPLMPDLECIPGSEVFSDSTQHYSLTANATGTPGLLFLSPDLLLQAINQSSGQTNNQSSCQPIKKKKKEKEETTTQEGTTTFIA